MKCFPENGIAEKFFPENFALFSGPPPFTQYSRKKKLKINKKKPKIQGI